MMTRKAPVLGFLKLLVAAAFSFKKITRAGESDSAVVMKEHTNTDLASRRHLYVMNQRYRPPGQTQVFLSSALPPLSCLYSIAPRLVRPLFYYYTFLVLLIFLSSSFRSASSAMCANEGLRLCTRRKFCPDFARVSYQNSNPYATMPIYGATGKCDNWAPINTGALARRCRP